MTWVVQWCEWFSSDHRIRGDGEFAIGTVGICRHSCQCACSGGVCLLPQVHQSQPDIQRPQLYPGDVQLSPFNKFSALKPKLDEFCTGVCLGTCRCVVLSTFVTARCFFTQIASSRKCAHGCSPLSRVFHLLSHVLTLTSSLQASRNEVALQVPPFGPESRYESRAQSTPEITVMTTSGELFCCEETYILLVRQNVIRPAG